MEPTLTQTPKPKIPFAAITTIGVLLSAALGGWWFTQSPVGTDMMEEETKNTPTTMRDILGYQGSQKCTFEESNDISQSRGTFYVSNGQARGDFESTIVSGPGAGTSVFSHMIVEGDTSYVWTEKENMGMKMSLKEVEGTAPELSRPDAPTASQLNESHSYECDSWDVDPSLFILPTEVTFTDLNSMMNGMMEGMPRMETGVPTGEGTAGVNYGSMEEIMSSQCAQCDNAGDARAECRLALGCK